jgi:DNA modification methylase
LIRAESRDISLALTPNHNCIISYPTTANNRTPCWRQKIITAKELKLGDKILSSAEYNKFLEYSIFKDDEIKLWAWILTEGGYDKKWNRICIYQNKGKKAKEIKNILNKLNINYTIYKRKKIFYNGYDRSKGLTFNIKSIDAKKIIKILPNKQMPVGYLYKMTKKQLELFVETLIKGDGHKRKSDGRNMFIQKDSQRTELFEIANVLLGKRVISKKTNYCTNDINHVYLTNHKYMGLRTTNGTSSKIFKEYYNGKVWCPSTSNGSFVAKRNGIIYITGNSFPPNLITPMILAGCPIDGIVLDPFMGSGTTAFTAKRLNRHYVGIELSKEYIKMAEKRIANELGLFAEI